MNYDTGLLVMIYVQLIILTFAVERNRSAVLEAEARTREGR